MSSTLYNTKKQDENFDFHSKIFERIPDWKHGKGRIDIFTPEKKSAIIMGNFYISKRGGS